MGLRVQADITYGVLVTLDCMDKYFNDETGEYILPDGLIADTRGEALEYLLPEEFKIISTGYPSASDEEQELCIITHDDKYYALSAELWEVLPIQLDKMGSPDVHFNKLVDLGIIDATTEAKWYLSSYFSP